MAASCVEIANTSDQQKKNEVFVETIASTTVGLVGGALVSLFLISNPVGWGTVLVLATGTAATSYIAGEYFRNSYTASGNKVDFVTGLGISSVCR